MRWYVVECPFYFRVLHPFRFLREIVVLRDRPARRLLLDALAFSGLGWVGLKGVHAWRGRRGGVRTELTTTVVDGFSGWVDAVWEQVRGSYAMAAVRDETILKTLYPASDPRFIRLRLDRAGVPVGWAVLLDTPMTAHSQFGRMRVGTVVDCLAVPGAEDEVVAAATRHLRGRGWTSSSPTRCTAPGVRLSSETVTCAAPPTSSSPRRRLWSRCWNPLRRTSSTSTLTAGTVTDLLTSERR